MKTYNVGIKIRMANGTQQAVLGMWRWTEDEKAAESTKHTIANNLSRVSRKSGAFQTFNPLDTNIITVFGNEVLLNAVIELTVLEKDE